MANLISAPTFRQYCQIFIQILVLFALPQASISQNFQTNQGTPDQEKRSCIQSVDGYAYLSENMTMAETRAAAFANAKRLAVERARTYIKSKSMVKNFVLMSDQITSNTEGSVTILEQKDHGVVDNTRYHVWIKAEVEYSLTTKEHTGNRNGLDGDAPLTVNVWTSKKQYQDGERIEIFLRGNRNFYARIVDITSEGDIIQLLPNDYRRINFFEAGKVYKIPDKGDAFELTVKPPYGEDQIVVYASEIPLGDVAMEQVGQGLRRYRGTRKTLAAMTRGIAVVGSEQGDVSGAEFYEATWTLKTGK